MAKQSLDGCPKKVYLLKLLQMGQLATISKIKNLGGNRLALLPSKMLFLLVNQQCLQLVMSKSEAATSKTLKKRVSEKDKKMRSMY